MHYALFFFTRFGWIENHQAAGADYPVVTGDHSYKTGGAVWQRLDVECAVRPERAAAIKRLILCPVRIHVHHDTREIVCQVGIFPTGVHHTPVVHHHRIPVAVLVKSQTAE